jgi:acetyl esterase
MAMVMARATAERKRMRTEIPDEADEPTKRLLEWVAASEQPPITEQNPEGARRAYEEGLSKVDLEPRAVAEVRNLTIDGATGPLPVRLYAPSPEGFLPLVLYFHGGGFVIGSIDSHDPLCREIAARTGSVVLSVGYRLAPEHPLPAAAQDARAALAWVVQHASDVGTDPGRLAVAGDSAGGTLAALTARQARTLGVPLRLQVLLYPALDQTGDYPSRHRYGAVWPIDRATIRWFERHQRGVDDVAPIADASPGRAHDVAGLAPTWILTAGLDPLQDEAVAYLEKLRAAGVPAQHHHVPGTVHGFLNFGRVLPQVGPTLDELAAALRAALGD